MPLNKLKLNTAQKTILGGAAINIKNIMKQSGGGKSITGGGVTSTKTMIQMYVVAVTACCFAKKYGAIPNIEVLVKYFFNELLDQGSLYKPEWLHVVLESIYLTYAHLGEDQSRPLACHDERDMGYITTYQPRAGTECDANVENFGELVTAICVTLLLTTLLAGGITIRALNLEGKRAVQQPSLAQTSSSSANEVQFVVMDKEKDAQMTQMINTLGQKDEQITLLLNSLREKDAQMANMIDLAYRQGAFPEIVNEITRMVEQLSGEVDPTADPNNLTVKTLNLILSRMRDLREKCNPPMNALIGYYPTPTNTTSGGYRKRNTSIKSRFKMKRNKTRHRRKKR